MKRRKFAIIVLLVSSLILSTVTAYAGNTDKERKIVVFSQNIDAKQKEEVLKKHDGVKIKDLDCINGVVVNLPKNNRLKDQDEVLYVEDDIIVSLNAKKPKPSPTPTPSEVIPWGIEYMGAPNMWSSDTDNIKVGVVDTGIDLEHPDLKENIRGSYNAISNNKSGNDDNGHGTHVAGIIAACQNGIGVVGMVPNADLYAIKVLDSTGSGYVSDIIEGFDWAMKNDMDILNMSFGTINDSQSLHDAIIKTSQAGITMVAAAGNNYGGACEYPAAYSEVVSVGALDVNGNIACFSAVDGVNVYAPGVDIYSTGLDGKYVEMDGTSMAAPHFVGRLINER